MKDLKTTRKPIFIALVPECAHRYKPEFTKRIEGFFLDALPAEEYNVLIIPVKGDHWAFYQFDDKNIEDRKLEEIKQLVEDSLKT